MKHYLLLGVALIAFTPFVSLAAYYMKLDGVDGETAPARAPVATTTTVTPTTVAVPPPIETAAPGPAPVPVLVMPTTGGSSGKVDTVYKVEKGEKVMEEARGSAAGQAPGIDPDEIDYDEDSKNATNFGILLGGSDTSDERKRGLERAAEVIRAHAEEAHLPMESISLNFAKIEYKYKTDARLFGFIPTTILATVEIDETEAATVKLPWWSFLVAGVEREEIGNTAKETLANILKAKRDAVTNAIRVGGE